MPFQARARAGWGPSKTTAMKAICARRMRHYTPGLVSRTFAALLLLNALFPFAAKGADAPSRPGASRVGPETCKACHQAAYELWRGGPHARAQEGLPQPSRK